MPIHERRLKGGNDVMSARWAIAQGVLPTCSRGHEIVNIGKADDFFEAFELSHDQCTMS